jgi:hypothetical protein
MFFVNRHYISLSETRHTDSCCRCTAKGELRAVNKVPGTKPITVDRVCKVVKTKQNSATIENYDIIIAHVAGPTYPGILEIKRLDQEL